MMSLHVVDVSKYQAERGRPLDLGSANAAGFGAVNIALDRGRDPDVLPVWAPQYAADARERGMGISTYRWVDGRLSGAESARRSLARMRALGGPDGMVHAADCEEDRAGGPATLAIITDYINAMQDGLQRHIALYSGRWWLKPRGWRLAELTPYLWAHPAGGYRSSYPGDDAPQWTVDYGGYSQLSLMQYRITGDAEPLIGKCSLTAVRDLSVWSLLEGGMPTVAQLKTESAYNRELVTPEMAEFGNALCQALGVPRGNFGVKGDNSPGHMRGGHRSQRWINTSRYCTNRTYTVESGLTDEELDYIPAFDITPKTREQMLTISRNLDKVTRTQGALEDLVEWYGNTDNTGPVDGWDNIRNAVISSDRSHDWHLHGRGKRRKGVLRSREFFRRLYNALMFGRIEGTGGSAMAFIDDIDARYLAYREHLFAGMLDEDVTNKGERVVHKGVTTLKQIAADLAAVKADVADIKAKQGEQPTQPAG